jgi:hypothetical protein
MITKSFFPSSSTSKYLFLRTKAVYSSSSDDGLKQGCQIVLGTWYQNRKKCTKWTQNVANPPKNIPNVCKMFQMFIKYINIFQTEALYNLPKFGFFVWKETIWQPWSNVQTINFTPYQARFLWKTGSGTVRVTRRVSEKVAQNTAQ